MRYLAFDIECCDGKHICEFGYVITNEKFEIQEKKVFLINPGRPFDLKNRSGEDELTLYFSEEEYYASPAFPTRYRLIKELIEYEDQIIIGHSIFHDISFLRIACESYNLAPIEFSFLDSQRVYGEFFNNKSISLQNAEATLELDKVDYLHKSDDDAKLTMEIVQSVCKRMGVTLSELMEMCPNACGESKNFGCYYKGDSFQEMLETIWRNPNLLSNKKKVHCLKMFAKRVKVSGELQQHALTNRTVCFSTIIEKKRIRDALALIQLLANVGGWYSSKVSDCDYYVAVDEELAQSEIPVNSRYYAATSPETKRNITVLTWNDFLGMLGVSEEALEQMEMPTVSPTKKSDDNHVCYSTGEGQSTLGDLLKAKGIDLMAMFR